MSDPSFLSLAISPQDRAELGTAPAVTSPRLGSVPYLNARPLTHQLPKTPRLLEPSRLSLELADGHLDAALVPLVEVLENAADYHIADGVAIGSRRSVYSVFLAHEKPVAEIKSVRLDPASKTSNQLVKVLLESFYKTRPRYLSPGDHAQADSQVWIGDPAIAFRQAHPDARVLDLAQAWRAATGLPCVFAVWAIRRETADCLALAKSLRRAARSGLATRYRLARNAFEQRYLYEHLCYELNDVQKKAIQRFSECLVQLGHLSHLPELSYL